MTKVREQGWLYAEFQTVLRKCISAGAQHLLLSSLRPGQPHLDNTDGLPGHVITGVDEESDQQDEASVPAGRGGQLGWQGARTSASTVSRKHAPVPILAASEPQLHQLFYIRLPSRHKFLGAEAKGRVGTDARGQSARGAPRPCSCYRGLPTELAQHQRPRRHQSTPSCSYHCPSPLLLSGLTKIGVPLCV